MKVFKSRYKNCLWWFYRMILPLINPLGLIRSLLAYPRYFAQFLFMRKQLSLHILDSYPCLLEATSNTSVDPHYFHMTAWATEKIFSSGIKTHVDVGSHNLFIASLSSLIPTEFVDLRPLGLTRKNLKDRKGSVLELPYENMSCHSVSCLHVIEHIGLGRYGDPLDAKGSEKACQELSRIVAPGGNLFLAVPCGKSKVCFNAHRVLCPQEILSWFAGFRFISLDAVLDDGSFVENCPIELLMNQDYGCGMFHLKRKL